MIDMGQLALAASPAWYRVASAHRLRQRSTSSYFDSDIGEVWLVCFTESDLHNPEAEPIGVGGNGTGDRRYFWLQAEWGECDFPRHGPDGLDAIAACNSDVRQSLDDRQAALYQRLTGPAPAVHFEWVFLHKLKRQSSWQS